MEELEGLVRGPWGYATAFLLGGLFGSFGNVCIYRIPAGLSIVHPPSHCFACKSPVAWYDNIPIVSYFVLRGKCRRCGAGYSPRYMAIELATALVSVALYYYCIEVRAGAASGAEPLPHALARYCVYLLFAFVLVVLALIDFDCKRLPDKITYPAIPAFFAGALLLEDIHWKTAVIGMALGYGIVRLISDGYWYLFKREGMGYGDGKLLALIGALLGWPAVVFALFLGSLLGSVIGVALLVWQRRRGTPVPPPETGGPDPEAVEVPLRHVEVPFGPFLIAATFVFLFLQEPIYTAFETFLVPLG